MINLGLRQLLIDLDLSNESDQLIDGNYKSFKLTENKDANQNANQSDKRTETSSKIKFQIKTILSQKDAPAANEVVLKVPIQYPLRSKRDTKDSFLTVDYNKCYSAEDILDIYSIGDNISKFDFHTLCPSLVYLAAKSPCVTTILSAQSFNKTKSAESMFNKFHLVFIFLPYLTIAKDFENKRNRLWHRLNRFNIAALVFGHIFVALFKQICLQSNTNRACIFGNRNSFLQLNASSITRSKLTKSTLINFFFSIHKFSCSKSKN
jgi:hypothetical protein